MQEDREQLLKTLENIRVFFDARADMAIGDAKIILAGYEKAIAAAIELLKAQEPVAPVKRSFTVSGADEYMPTPLMDVCGACGEWLPHAAPRAKYCPSCGQAVKWE